MMITNYILSPNEFLYGKMFFYSNNDVSVNNPSEQKQKNIRLGYLF